MSLYMYLCLYLPFHASKLSFSIFAYYMHIGMAMGRGGSEGWSLCPRLTWFFLIPFPPRPASHDSKNFLTPFPPLGALRSPVPPRKTQLFINLPTIIAIVFNKTCFVSKNILEIKNKFISSNQTNF